MIGAAAVLGPEIIQETLAGQNPYGLPRPTPQALGLGREQWPAGYRPADSGKKADVVLETGGISIEWQNLMPQLIEESFRLAADDDRAGIDKGGAACLGGDLPPKKVRVLDMGTVKRARTVADDGNDLHGTPPKPTRMGKNANAPEAPDHSERERKG